jgi:hypothetical protein
MKHSTRPAATQRRLVAALAGVVIGSGPGVGLCQTGGESTVVAPAAQIGALAEQDQPAGMQPRTDGGAGLPGRALLQLRPRYSYVDQSSKAEPARAVNMRMLLGYQTAPIGDFAFAAQLVDVSWLEPKRASNTPGDFLSEYPLVGDPDKSDVNLLYADYLGVGDLRIRLGRQMIKLDNERFVGSADVRQMPQVFDAISARYTGIPDTEINAVQAWHVRTYFGNRFQTRTTLLNARVLSGFGLSAGVYGYFQDQPQINNGTGLADNSNRILGARLEGNTPAANGLSWYYTAEAAQQRPYAGGDQRIRASYQRLALGPSWRGYSTQLNYERLGSNQGLYGFQTPLSYNNFQGWAYSFFTTPAVGVRDLNASLGAVFGRLDLKLKHHRFKADFGGAALGTEWDFALAYRINESMSIAAVFGQFRSEPASVRPTGPRAAFGQMPAPSADRYYLSLQYDY